jgi:hypothetical protein
VTAYGYPFIDGGAVQLKNNLILELRGLITQEVHLIQGELNNSLLSLTKGVGEYLEPYEALKTINVEELNEAIKKVNRLPF